jgi:hypothetical protein
MDTSLIILMGVMGWILRAENTEAPRALNLGKVPKRGYGCKCIACGEDGLHWTQVGGKWCLFLVDQLHLCSVTPWHEETVAEIMSNPDKHHVWSKAFSNK